MPDTVYQSDLHEFVGRLMTIYHIRSGKWWGSDLISEKWWSISPTSPTLCAALAGDLIFTAAFCIYLLNENISHIQTLFLHT